MGFRTSLKLLPLLGIVICYFILQLKVSDCCPVPVFERTAIAGDHRSVQKSTNRRISNSVDSPLRPQALQQNISILKFRIVNVSRDSRNGHEGMATLQFKFTDESILVKWLEGELEAPIKDDKELIFLTEAIFDSHINFLSYTTDAVVMRVQGSNVLSLKSSLVCASQFGQEIEVHVENPAVSTEISSVLHPPTETAPKLSADPRRLLAKKFDGSLMSLRSSILALRYAHDLWQNL